MPHTTAFTVFCRHERAQIIEESSVIKNFSTVEKFADLPVVLHPNAILFLLSFSWKFLTPEQKQIYEDEARAIKNF